MRNLLTFSLLAVLIVAGAITVRSEQQKLAREDDAFLEDLSRRSFQFFWEQANTSTGLVLDRARTDGSPHVENRRHFASIASTGFGLTALCIAAERKWIDPAEARNRVLTTLRFFAEKSPSEHGWFYHFVDARTGERWRESELSSIDTTLLLGGYLRRGSIFEMIARSQGSPLRYTNAWISNGCSMGIRRSFPTDGGLKAGSSSIAGTITANTRCSTCWPSARQLHAISPESWNAWRRDWIEYAGLRYLSGAPPLFIHQFSHAWIDYRGKREKNAPQVDYFENSVKATQAHRQFCIDLRKEFPGYSENIWGITASDSARGYLAWGGPPRTDRIDGTVVPCAAAGSLMFTPEISYQSVASYEDAIRRTYLRPLWLRRCVQSEHRLGKP